MEKGWYMIAMSNSPVWQVQGGDHVRLEAYYHSDHENMGAH